VIGISYGNYFSRIEDDLEGHESGGITTVETFMHCTVGCSQIPTCIGVKYMDMNGTCVQYTNLQNETPFTASSTEVSGVLTFSVSV